MFISPPMGVRVVPKPSLSWLDRWGGGWEDLLFWIGIVGFLFFVWTIIKVAKGGRCSGQPSD